MESDVSEPCSSGPSALSWHLFGGSQLEMPTPQGRTVVTHISGSFPGPTLLWDPCPVTPLLTSFYEPFTTLFLLSLLVNMESTFFSSVLHSFDIFLFPIH